MNFVTATVTRYFEKFLVSNCFFYKVKTSLMNSCVYCVCNVAHMIEFAGVIHDKVAAFKKQRMSV